MKFQVTSGLIESTKVDCIVVMGLRKNESVGKRKSTLQLGDGGASLDSKLNGVLSELLEREVVSCELDTYWVVTTRGELPAKYVVIVGGGDVGRFTKESARAIGAKMVDIAKELKIKSIAGMVMSQKVNDVSAAERVQAIVEGMVISGYQYGLTKKASPLTQDSSLEKMLFVQKGVDVAPLNEAVKYGKIVGEAVNYARDLVNGPANVVTPAYLANEAKGLAKRMKLGCKILGEREIKAEKMGLLQAVSKGSESSPVLIHMSYRPSKASKEKIALVGKGVTFDTGGLDMKNAVQMAGMKHDMGGAAAMLATMRAIAELKPAVAVDLVIPACENSVDSRSMRPGDVYTARNGKTVEIDNTDAEGRLVLGDAIDYAISKQADVIIDAATLTGGVFHALGSLYTAVLGNDQPIIDKLIKAGEQTGEPMWQLPMPDVYSDGFKSDVADMKNMSTKGGSTIKGALFLKAFVKEGIKWGHLDIAESAWKEGREKVGGILFTNATGAPVRALVHFLMKY